MADKFLLSVTEGERDILRALLRAFRGRNPGEGIPSSPQSPEGFENDHQAPETYIALTPVLGIPALETSPGFTGTGSPPTDTDPDNDVPGSAMCQIYRIRHEDSSPEMIKIDGLVKTVYNLSGAGIDGNTWVLVTRDKFGAWIVVGSATTDDIDLTNFVDVVTEVCLITDSVTDTGTSTGISPPPPPIP